MTPSEQARADALADAETLGRIAHERGERSPYVRSYIWAQNYGLRCLDAIYGRNRGTAGAMDAYSAAGAAAHSAFRAVPGLR